MSSAYAQEFSRHAAAARADARASRGARTPTHARVYVLAFFICVAGAQAAHAQVSVVPVTWNVIGLDSNKWSQGVGPDTFQIGARACNVGASAVANITGTFFWDSSNPYINLATAAANPVTYASLPVGGCTDFYFPVTVSRVGAVFTTNPSRRYHITISGTGVSSVSTPTPRELYVESLISQNRNTIVSITGPTNVYVGQSYTFRLVADTSTQGYDQLEAFINLSNVVFQVQSISTTYSAPAGLTNDKFYIDACGWNNVPGSAGYLDCTNSGKAGGTITSDYTVKILAAGTGPITLGALILDHSGGSFHYNADNGDPAKQLNISALPPPLSLAKTVSASPVLTGSTVTYTLRVTNSGPSAYTLADFVDTPPASPGTPAYVAGSSKFNNVAIGNPTASGGKLTWSGSFPIPAGQTRDLTYQMTMPASNGNYVNTAVAHFDAYQIDTTQDVTDNSPASVNLRVNTPPNVALVKSVSPSGTQLPGTDLTYTVAFANSGDTAAQQLVLVDPDSSTTLKINDNTDFKVGSAATTLGGLAGVTVTYSNNGGSTWTYTPASAAGGAPAGYDRNVTHVRWTFTGTLVSAASGSVSFTARIR